MVKPKGRRGLYLNHLKTPTPNQKVLHAFFLIDHWI